MEAFNNLDLLLRGFWLVAIPVTIIFLIQMVLTFIGSDASDGTSADFDAILMEETLLFSFSLSAT